MPQPIMTGSVDHPLVQAIIDYQRTIATRDTATARAIFHDDVIYIVPGTNLFSGTYHGPEAVMSYFGRLMEATGGSYEIAAMDWLICGEKVLLTTQNDAVRGAASLAWREAILFEFRDGKKARIEMFQADQSAVDEFFAR